MGYVIAVDIGGTHTDCLASDGRTVEVYKVLTTLDPSDAVIECVEIIAKRCGSSIHEFFNSCERFVYGSTIATNMFIQHRLPKIGLLCTKGYRDSLWFRDGYKPDRWNIRLPPPWSLVPRYLRRPIEERVNYRGEVLIPLNEDDVCKAARMLRDEEVEAVAICFLFSFLNPAHEQRARQIVEGEMPDIPVVISWDVLPRIREWERTFCTCLSAAIAQETSTHFRSLTGRLRELGFKGEPLIMQSNGGYSTIEGILKRPLYLLGSGPAGGALAGCMYGELTHRKDILTIDMGGTSFDVCLLSDRKVPITKYRRLENEPIAIPCTDIHTIGAGGGTIAWVDSGGALQVGPYSTGATPGPACYGRGGTEPTITDAYLVLGYLNPDFFLGGRVRLHCELAEKAIRERIAKPQNLSLISAASSIVEIANRQMADAMRIVSVERGIDPSPYTVVAGGGAGPLQAGRLAEAMGMSHVIIPRQPGGLCSLGLIWANILHERLRTYLVSADKVDLDVMSTLYKEMETSLEAELLAEGIPRQRIELKRHIDARYIGQVYELEVDVPQVDKFEPEHLNQIVRRFEDIHEGFYHYRMTGFPVEFVDCRVQGVGEVPRIRFDELTYSGPDSSGALKEKRKVFLPRTGEFGEVPIYDGERLKYGNTLSGVAIIETEGSTIGVWENEQLVVNKYGDFELEVKEVS